MSKLKLLVKLQEKWKTWQVVYLLHAKSVCDLPRDHKQVDNQAKRKLEASFTCYKSDILALAMQMCKDSSDDEPVFIRSVEAVPEPMCTLATNQQLLDMDFFVLEMCQVF